MSDNNPMKAEIFAKQYAIREGETFEEGVHRVVDYVFPEGSSKLNQTDKDRLKEMFLDDYASPGGRVWAGAGSEHGNLLNCFVQNGAPHKAGSFAWSMLLAKNLALVTKVGGGNGLNLDPYPAKGTPPPRPAPRVFLTIYEDHPDSDNLYKGRYMNLVTGQYETKGYRVLQPMPHADLTTVERGPNQEAVQLVVSDSVEGIWNAAATMIEHMRNDTTVLLDLSLLRAEGKPVKGSGGNSSGPASFAVEIFDNFAFWEVLGGEKHAGPVAALRYLYAPTLRVIRQGGVRRGAGMATLSANHADVMDFVTSKDLEREAVEGDIGTFNISVLGTDDFMELANDSGTRQHGLLNQIATHAWQTGEPGFLFVDTINELNALSEMDGPILATNPCGEIGLYPGEPCDLGAMNLARYIKRNLHNEPMFNMHQFKRDVNLMVRFLDEVLTVEKSPLPQIAEAIKDKRRIGLGLMGLSDMLIEMGASYASKHGRQLVTNAVQAMTTEAINTSMQLAREAGGSPKGIERATEDVPSMAGRNNIALLTVAPTGTTAMMAGVSSGIEPVYSAVTYRRIGTDYYQIVHPLLMKILDSHKPFGRFTLMHVPESETDKTYMGWNMEALAEAISEHHGSIMPLVEQGDLPEDRRLEVFLTAHDVKPMDHVRMQATVQKAFDFDKNDLPTFAGNSISKTINLPKEAKVEDVLHCYREAWLLGCKGITVYRDGSRQFQVLSTSKQEDSVEEEQEPMQEPVVKTGSSNYPIKRPAVVSGTSHKYQVGGRKTYVQVFHNDQDQMVEVWTPASKGATASEQTSHSIIGRLISLSLKHGASPLSVMQALQGHMDETGGVVQNVGYIGSKWDLVAHAMGQSYDAHTLGDENPAFTAFDAPSSDAAHGTTSVSVGALSDLAGFSRVDTTLSCDACDGEHMLYENGCATCTACGYSKCG